MGKLTVFNIGGGKARLIAVVGEDENHPLASLMEVIGVLIEKYEDDHVPELTAKPGELG